MKMWPETQSKTNANIPPCVHFRVQVKQLFANTTAITVSHGVVSLPACLGNPLILIGQKLINVTLIAFQHWAFIYHNQKHHILSLR